MLQSLVKIVLIPLRLTEAASGADIGIHKKILGSGTAALIISNEEIEDIINIANYLEDSGLLTKDVSETIQNEVKQNSWYIIRYISYKFIRKYVDRTIDK